MEISRYTSLYLVISRYTRYIFYLGQEVMFTKHTFIS